MRRKIIRRLDLDNNWINWDFIKGYISKIENNMKEVRISTLQKIVELGLGGRL